MDDDHDDPTILAEIEARANLTMLATLARHYFLALLEEGFEPGEALALTIAKTTT